jgi:site-specific recombinase XerD
MRRWDRFLDAYLEGYRARGLAEETVRHTERILTDWGQWLKRRRPRPVLERIDAPLLVRYLKSRSAFRAKATVYGTLSTMRGMGDYLVHEGVWQVNPLRWMRGPKVTPYSRLPQRLETEQLQALWRCAAASRGEFSRHLWVTVLALLYGTGLRRGELERLDVGSFDRLEQTLRIDGRKTGRERCVPVPALVGRCIEVYLPQRHNRLERTGALGQTALLVTRAGQRLSAEAVSQGVHRMARRAGVTFRSLHQFRHSCASDLLEAGVHLAEVQRILGHQVIATTVRYTHIADPQRRAAIAVHPLNDWLVQEAAA